MRWLQQVLSVTWLSLQTLGQRLGSSVVAILGIAGVVLVFVAVFSIAQGFRATLVKTGGDENVLVLRSGSATEMTSGFGLEETKILAEAPGIAQGENGPMASAELFVIVDLNKRSTGTIANVPFRGVQAEAFNIRQSFEIKEGRNFVPGRREIIAGEGAFAEFEIPEVGGKLRLGQADWTVVGIFSTGGTVADSELWADVKVLQPTYNRGNSFQSLYAKLSSPAEYDDFKEALTTDPRLNVRVMKEREYYAEQSQILDLLIKVIGTVVASAMAAGAVFGALLTLFAAVASRRREIATLRALGFQRGPVVVSVMTEAMLLALVGGLLGGGLAYFLFNGYRAATLNYQSFSQVTFAFAVTPGLITLGVVGALVIGFFGGLPPAIRAAWQPVAHALRQS